MHYVRPVTRQHQICSYADAMDDAKQSGVRVTINETVPVHDFEDMLGGGDMRRIGFALYCPSADRWEAYLCGDATPTDRAIVLGVVASYQADGQQPTAADRRKGWTSRENWRDDLDYLQQELVRPTSDLSDAELDFIDLGLSMGLAVPDDLSEIHALASGVRA